MSGDATLAKADIAEEHGQWVVYLCVSFWHLAPEPHLEVVRRRIRAYPTLRQAEIAGQWMARTANKEDLGLET